MTYSLAVTKRAKTRMLIVLFNFNCPYLPQFCAYFMITVLSTLAGDAEPDVCVTYCNSAKVVKFVRSVNDLPLIKTGRRHWLS